MDREELEQELVSLTGTHVWWEDSMATIRNRILSEFDRLTGEIKDLKSPLRRQYWEHWEQIAGSFIKENKELKEENEGLQKQSDGRAMIIDIQHSELEQCAKWWGNEKRKAEQLQSWLENFHNVEFREGNASTWTTHGGKGEDCPICNPNRGIDFNIGARESCSIGEPKPKLIQCPECNGKMQFWIIRYLGIDAVSHRAIEEYLPCSTCDGQGIIAKEE